MAGFGVLSIGDRRNGSCPTRVSGGLYYVLLATLGMLAWPAAGLEAEDAHPPQSEQTPPCVMHFDLPDGARLNVDGRDYGASAKLTFQKLQPGKEYNSRIKVVFAGGGIAERKVKLHAGDELHLAESDFRDHPEATYRHPLVCTRAAEAAISPDGKIVVALASDRKSALLFEFASGALVRRITGHEGEIYNVAFSADGTRVATSATDNSARVFDVASGKLLRKIVPPEFPKFAERVPSYRPFRPFYNLTESMGAGLESGLEAALVEPLRQRYSHVTAVTFSPDGRFLVSSQYDGSVRLWDAATGRPLRQFCGPQSSYSNDFLPVIDTAAFSADGRYVTAADRSGYVRAWETHSGRQVLRIRADASSAISAQYAPDGKHLLTLGSDGVARIWDASSGKHLHMLHNAESGLARAACFAPDGQAMTLGSDTAVRFWDAGTGKELRALPVGPSFVAKSLLVADPAGQSLLTDGLLGVQSRSTSTGLIGHLFRAAEE